MWKRGPQPQIRQIKEAYCTDEPLDFFDLFSSVPLLMFEISPFPFFVCFPFFVFVTFEIQFIHTCKQAHTRTHRHSFLSLSHAHTQNFHFRSHLIWIPGFRLPKLLARKKGALGREGLLVVRIMRRKKKKKDVRGKHGHACMDASL